MTPAAQQIWLATLAIGAAALVVIVVLLTWILRLARRIRAAVSSIWTGGQTVAGYTIHLAQLDTTNHLFGEVLTHTRQIVATMPSIGRPGRER